MILLPVFPLAVVQIKGDEPGHKHMGHLGMGMTGQDQLFTMGVLVGIKTADGGAIVF